METEAAQTVRQRQISHLEDGLYPGLVECLGTVREEEQNKGALEEEDRTGDNLRKILINTTTVLNLIFIYFGIETLL